MIAKKSSSLRSVSLTRDPAFPLVWSIQLDGSPQIHDFEVRKNLIKIRLRSALNALLT